MLLCLSLPQNQTPIHSHMAFLPLLLLLLLLLTFSAVPYASSANSTLSAYEVLEEYDFPIGLLPKGVLGYKLNSSTGKFSVYLNGTCTYTVDSYKLKYSSTITGVISKDKLKSLSGIKVKVLLFWLSITEVIRDGDELEFSVGIASADFPVSNFNECPTCGCGFDCDTVKSNGWKDKFNRLVSTF